MNVALPDEEHPWIVSNDAFVQLLVHVAYAAMKSKGVYTALEVTY